MSREVDVLGRGVRFPFGFSAVTGGVGVSQSVSISEGIEHVRESISQILGTQVGSRAGRRDFGSRLREAAFMPHDETAILFIEHYVRDAILRWEKRVRCDDVSIDSSERKQGLLKIMVKFTILRTNVSGSLVYPYYLAIGEG